MKRNDKYIGWAMCLFLLAIPMVAIGAVVWGVLHSVTGGIIMLLAPVFMIVGAILKSKDDTLNRDFDKEEHDKEQWMEYKRLKDKYDNENPPK